MSDPMSQFEAEISKDGGGLDHAWNILNHLVNTPNFATHSPWEKSEEIRMALVKAKLDLNTIEPDALNAMLDALGVDARAERHSKRKTIYIRPGNVNVRTEEKKSLPPKPDVVIDIHESKADVEVKSDEQINPVDPDVAQVSEQLGEEPDDALPVLDDEDNFTELSGMDYKHGFDTTDAEQNIRYVNDEVGVLPEDEDFIGGANGDVPENGIRYLDVESDGEIDEKNPGQEGDPTAHDYEITVGMAGLPRTERKFGSQIAGDNVDHNWDGGAGDDPESIGLRDFNRTQLIDVPDEEKYGGMVASSLLAEDFGDPSAGLDKSDLERMIQKARRKGGKMPKLFPTKTIRQRQPEEGGNQQNRRNRYDQVSLVRESSLNHMRSVSELMPTA